MSSEKEEKQMTLEEYKEKYTKPENTKQIRLFLFLFVGMIGIVILTCLVLLVLRLFDLHKIAGYVGIGVAVLIFIFIYIVPIVQIGKTKAFKTNINSRTAKEAKRYNRALRNEIADKMIDYTAKVEGANWYNDELVGKLAIARQANRSNDVKEILTQIYKTDVQKSANKIIRDHAIKVGIVTAMSQDSRLDTLFVATYELSLIKDIVYLYGYRPSDAKLMKIYRGVIKNSLMAYGVSTSSTAMVSGIMKGIKSGINDIPVLGALISTAIGSVSQGLINGTMTAVIGMQTKSYLVQEYHLQDILDGIQLETAEEDIKQIEMISHDVDVAIKNKDKKKDKKKDLEALTSD